MSLYNPASGPVNAVEAAHIYMQQGWGVVPVPAGEKGLKLAGWQKGGFTEQDFRPDNNIGILPGRLSGGLIDVDLDCPETLELGREFLPSTGMIHGRGSTPESHYWYQIIDAIPEKSVRYRDIEKFYPATNKKEQKTLIELRSDGVQTIVPPSLHPSGEQLVWNSQGEPGCITFEELDRIVRFIAAVALVARNWAGDGSRHDCVLALAGYLYRGGLEESRVVYLVDRAARLAGDDQVSDRRKAAMTTIERIKQGQPATGGPSLAAYLDEVVVRRLRDWLQLTSSPISLQTLEGARDQNAPGKSAADTMLKLAKESGATFFVDEKEQPYARVPKNGHYEIYPVRQSSGKHYSPSTFRA